MTAQAAGSTRIGYEIANALGALHSLCPKLAAKCNAMHNYAKAVQTYLRAVDFYCYQKGVRPERVRVSTTLFADRIEQEFTHR